MRFDAVTVLNDDGGVFDASLVAAVAALSGVSLPSTTKDKEGVVKLTRQKPATRLSLSTALVPLTCGISDAKGIYMYIYIYIYVYICTYMYDCILIYF